MKQSQLINQFLDQSKDLVWIVNLDFQLIYANQTYFNFMEDVTGAEKKLNESAFIDCFGKDDIKTWTTYYKRAFSDEYFEVEEHFYNEKSGEIQYNQVTFEPLRGNDQKIFAVACQSRDITRIAKLRSEASQLIDASLDVFCTFNEQGEFIYVSAAAKRQWGYSPEELIGTPYRSLVIEEDLAVTDSIDTTIKNGQEIKSFSNRFRKKDGGIAYNFWSSRWDERAKLYYSVARDGKEKIKQEEELLKSEQRFKALVTGAFDLVAVLDATGSYIFMSPSITAVAGIPPEEFIGKNAFDFVHPDDIKQTKEELEKSINEGRVIMKPYRAKNHKNEWRWVESVLTNMLDNSAIHGIVINSRDITEKIEQEEKLLQSEKRFKALIQEGSDLIGILDTDGNYSYVSPTSNSVLGIPPEEFIGRNAFEFIHPDDEKRVLAKLRKVTTENKETLEPYRFLNHKKEWRWVETVLTNMLDNPSVKGIVANSRDITDKVEQEEKIIRTEKRFETLIENSSDCITIISPEGETIYFSKAIKNIIGYSPSEAMKLDIWELIHPEDVEGSKAAIIEAMKNPGVSIEGHTSRIRHKDGTWRWVKAIVTNLIHDPSIGGIVDVISDITKQKTEELEKDLINRINHTFNQKADNDLTTILSDVSEQIVSFCGFSFAEMWLPTFDNEKINLTAGFTGSKAGKTFHKESKKLKSLPIEEGLSNHVLKNKKTVIWESVDDEWNLFIRKEAAERAGIKSLIAIPLRHNDELLGGLLIGTEKAKSSFSLNLELFHKLESVLGSELSRKKIEIELSQIFNFTPDMICVAGFDGYFKRMNPAGLSLLGYSLDEIQSRPIKSFVHEQDQSRTEENQNKLYNGKTLDNFENRYITKAGKVIWLNWTATTLPKQGIIYAVAKNITEEKQLRELNRQVGLLVKIGSWEVDLVKETVFWSDEVHKLYGTDPNTFVPTVDAAINFYREDFRELALSSFETCIETGESYDIEAVIVTSNNKERWVRTTAKAEYIDGACVRVYGSFQNINERKQAEMRLQSFSENLPGVVYQYIIHPDGTDSMQFISGMVEKLWGYTTNEVIENIDLLWDQIKLGGDIEEVRSSIAKSIETKSRWTCRFKIINHTGEIKTHLGSGTPNFLADGTILFHVMVLDITQEAKNEALLEQITKIARIGSWELDLVNQDGESMYWSPMLLEMVEVEDSYKPTLTEGIEFHIGESKERIQKALELLIADGTEFDEEILLLTAKGNERWSRAIGKSEMVNNERIRIYGSYQDIHDRKVADLELERSLKELKDYKFSLDQAAIIAFTDSKGVITSVNDNFCHISKYNREEIVGKTHRLINSQYHSSDFFRELWKTIASGNVWRGEIKNKAKDGSYYWVDTTIVPFLDEKNKPFKYLAIRFDITERKKAEQEKNSLQETIENSLNEIYIFDAEMLQFSYVNKGALLNLGYSEEEIKALTPLDLKPDYTKTTFQELIKPLEKNEKEKIVFFTNHKRKNGSLYPVEVHLQLVTQGNIKRFLAIILDITERKEADKHLLQANERFEKVTEATNDAIWDWDISEQRFYRSKAIERFFGKKTSQLFTEDDFWKDQFNPEDLSRVQKSLQEALADPSRKRWESEYRIYNEHGETLYVIDRGVIVRNDNGKAIRMVGAMTDISEQKKSDEENKFKANLLSVIGQAAIATNLDGIVNYWNKAAENIYGWEQEEAIGKNIMKLTTPEANEERAKEIMEELKKGKRWSGEFTVRKKDGTDFPAKVSNSPIFDENNKLAGIIGISSDITKEVHNKELLKQYTVELERSNEELEQFAFIASHDLQEPLRMISSFMDLLQRKYEDKLDEKALQYIHFATDGSKRMKQIILDLLDYSRATKPTEGKEEVDLNEVLSDFKQLRRKLISEKNAKIIAKDLPTLNTYKAAITQILHCLIDNALKYTLEGIQPIIEINAEENEIEWVFSVKDNGIGIDPQFYDKIFIIFQRLHNKDKYAGTGIGLSIAKRHVEFLGGRIWLESETGNGSIFYFTTPKN